MSIQSFEEALDALHTLYAEHIETKMLLASIVECSHDAIFSKTLDGIITSWNASAERIYGYTAAEAIGQHVSFLLPPDHPHEVEQIMEQLKRGERVDHFETVRLSKTGEIIPVSLTISPIVGIDGKPTGASAIAHELPRPYMLRKRA